MADGSSKDGRGAGHGGVDAGRKGVRNFLDMSQPAVQMAGMAQTSEKRCSNELGSLGRVTGVREDRRL